MTTTLRRHAWTVEDVARMVDAGVLGREDRVELVGGEVVDKVVIGSRHVAAVNRLNQMLVVAAGGHVVVSPQNPVVLDEHSQPEPDLAILRPRDDGYVSALPSVTDVVLLVDVADSSAAEDRRAKLPRYAHAGVPEVWLVDLVAGALERHREPGPDGYAAVELLVDGDVEAALAPGLRLRVVDVLGPR